MVSATGVAGLISDVTTSAIAFDSSELEAIGAQDVSDLARFTPNLEINTTAATTPTFFIRGVGLNDANSNAAGAIAIYVDDVPINAPAIQLTSLFDTESVEVLRGPQAHIDARNASGGMINTISRKPDGEYSAFVRSDFGRFEYRDIEGALGFPILGERLSARLAFRSTARNDLVGNRCGSIVGDVVGSNVCGESRTVSGVIPDNLPSETNDLNRWAARAQVRYRPELHAFELDVLVNGHVARIDQKSPLGQVVGTAQGAGLTASRYVDPAVARLFEEQRDLLNANPPPGSNNNDRVTLARNITQDIVTRDIEKADPFENDYDLIGDEVLTQFGGFVRFDVDFEDVTFKSITAVERYDRERDTDFDFGPNPSIHTFREDDSLQLSQNIGISGGLEDLGMTLSGGAYFLAEILETESLILLETSQSPRRELIQVYDQDLFSFGVFANAEWQIREDLTVEGGVRVNWERKDFKLGVQRIQNRNRPPTPSDPAELTRTWSAPTFGLQVTHDMTEDLYAFAKYTRGWKAGHINASVLEVRTTDGRNIATSTPTVAKPETIDAIEVGFGADLFDQALGFSVNSFYYKYADYQVFLIEAQAGSPPQLEVINANDARIYGLEADLELKPLLNLGWVPEQISGLRLTMNFAWLESEFLDFSDIRSFLLPSNDPLVVRVGSALVDFTGNRLPNTPQFQTTVAIEWRLELGSLGSLTPRWDMTWKDDIFFDPSQGRGTPNVVTREELSEYAVGQRAYALHDLRLTYEDASGMISVAGWVRNLTDEVYKRNVLDVSTAFDQVNSFVGDPRTYGISVGVKY